MKIKLLRIVGLTGLLIFLATLVIFITMDFFYPRLLVTVEFSRSIHLYALTLAVYAGLSLIFVFFTNILSASQSFSRQKLIKDLKKQAGTLFVEILVSSLIGYMMYNMFVNIIASTLHKNAPKETTQFEVITTSAWPARRDFRKNCQHHLLFDSPKISPEIQSICINWDQWLYFKDADFPITVTLYGKKSFYGYELSLYKIELPE